MVSFFLLSGSYSCCTKREARYITISMNVEIKMYPYPSLKLLEY